MNKSRNLIVKLGKLHQQRYQNKLSAILGRVADLLWDALWIWRCNVLKFRKLITCSTCVRYKQLIESHIHPNYSCLTRVIYARSFLEFSIASINYTHLVLLKDNLFVQKLILDCAIEKFLGRHTPSIYTKMIYASVYSAFVCFTLPTSLPRHKKKAKEVSCVGLWAVTMLCFLSTIWLIR